LVKHYRLLSIKIKKYYQLENEIENIHAGLKFTQCPYCKLVGLLIMHGFLYGYDEQNNKPGFIRGRRFFCSNRNKKIGCGRTINIFKTLIIKSFTYTANTIWDFLNNILNNFNIFQAFKILNIPFSSSTPYRLFSKFKLKQSELRTALNRIKSPPDNSTYSNPVFQTIEHLRHAFKNYDCPAAAYQYAAQSSIL